MQADQNSEFLNRELSRLLPEVFFNPAWIHFVRNIADYSPNFIQNLLYNLQQEQAKGDMASNCQVMFLCASLQLRIGDDVAALECIHQAWKLAELHGLQRFALSAAWGARAICVHQGKYQEAVNWLIWLQSKLKEEDDWILANILEVFRQTLEGQEQAPGSNGEFITWLLNWGMAYNAESAPQSLSGKKIRPADHPLASQFSRLAYYWGSFWRTIRHIIGGKWLAQRSTHPDEPDDVIQDKDGGSNSTTQASRFDGMILPASTGRNEHSSQMLSGISNLSAPLLQSKILPFHHHSSLSTEAGRPYLAVYCLGPFLVYQDDKLIKIWPSGKGRAIFKYMIANHRRPISKYVLMDIFWRKFDPEAACKNLYVAIYGLRQAFRAMRPEFSHILFQDDHYLLNPSMQIWVDIEEFCEHYQAGRRLERSGRLNEALREYELAKSLYQGDFLEEDLYEDWALPLREGLKENYVVILDCLSRHCLEEKRYATCIQLCQNILAEDDCRENAHRRLMRCYSRQGQPLLALRQYHLCVEALMQVEGVSPMYETLTLFNKIRGGEAV